MCTTNILALYMYIHGSEVNIQLCATPTPELLITVPASLVSRPSTWNEAVYIYTIKECTNHVHTSCTVCIMEPTHQ